MQIRYHYIYIMTNHIIPTEGLVAIGNQMLLIFPITSNFDAFGHLSLMVA